jgi:hypothetical protein
MSRAKWIEDVALASRTLGPRDQTAVPPKKKVTFKELARIVWRW